MPLEANCTNEEKVNVSLHPVTSTGRPAQVDANNPPTYVVQSGDGTTAPAADGLSCFVLSGDNPGDTVVLISADADLGDGVETITDLFTLHVAGARAANVGLQADAPVPK